MNQGAKKTKKKQGAKQTGRTRSPKNVVSTAAILIPTKKQFSDWSLPSKYALIGVVVGIFGIAVAIYALCLSPSKSDFEDATSKGADKVVSNQSEHFKRLERLLTEAKNSLQDVLVKKYPFGWAIFYIDGKSIIYRDFRNKDFFVDWNKAEIDKYFHDSVAVGIPHIEHLPTQNQIFDLALELPSSKNFYGRFFNLPFFSVHGETILTEHNLPLYVIGIAPRNVLY